MSNSHTFGHNLQGLLHILIIFLHIYIFLRLSRGCRVVENAFGMLANRFRILHRPISLESESIDSLVQTCCILHNFLRTHSPEDDDFDREDENHDIQPANWRRTQPPLETAEVREEENDNAERGLSSNHRDELCEYFMSAAGEVPWQHRIANAFT